MPGHPYELGHAETDEEIASCFGVIQVLRPHIVDVAAFVEQVKRQRAHGYRLMTAHQEAKVVGLAGYRATEDLISGRFIYLDDLVVAQSTRSSGVGAALLDAVAREGVAANCTRLVLDTGVSNSQAQRFYFREHLILGAFRLSRALS